MRKTVAKKLRAGMRGTPKMKHKINKDRFVQVDHYRNAKKFYNGSVSAAIRDAENYAATNLSIGRYI